ncbi:putative carboxylesterase, type B, alpha/Beta hydrolase [Septoria linicola]|nr:putative carboxylesterase, type B, alpha/Beta hydrolase [Septoria linicola]
MEHLPALGTAVGEIVKPTLQLYEPLLLQNKDKILSIPKATYSYGTHDRQKLDLYTALKPSSRNGRTPILIFCYGGGLTMGHKTLPGYAEDLCHANIASFFALKHGYHVVVPDYRLVGKHDAKFPSGGEDVALTIEWISEHADHFGPEPVDIFIMGNSAGGIHTSTFLLHESFKNTRARVLFRTGPRLRGAILLSVPFHMRKSSPSRSETNKTYFGDAEANAPLGLLKTARQTGDIDFVQAGVRTFILNGDLDPVDEILQPRDDFIEEWLSVGTKQSTSSLAVDMMLGHNHISPFCSLGTGNEEEEAWGHQVAAFCDNVRLFRP